MRLGIDTGNRLVLGSGPLRWGDKVPIHHVRSFPICPFCDEAVELETTKTNEDGKAVHEECYVKSISPPRSEPSSSTGPTAA